VLRRILSISISLFQTSLIEFANVPIPEMFMRMLLFGCNVKLPRGTMPLFLSQHRTAAKHLRTGQNYSLRKVNAEAAHDGG